MRVTQHGIEVGTGLADAVLAGGGDLAPELGGVGQVRDLRRGRPCSVPGAQCSTARKIGISSRRRKLACLGERPEAKQAEVVAAPLHHRDAQVAAQGAGQERNVLVDELLLEVLGAGGDHHAPAQLDGGKEVGQGLARARAGLGKEHAAVRQRPDPPPRTGAPGRCAPRTLVEPRPGGPRGRRRNASGYMLFLLVIDPPPGPRVWLASRRHAHRYRLRASEIHSRERAGVQGGATQRPGHWATGCVQGGAAQHPLARDEPPTLPLPT